MKPVVGTRWDTRTARIVDADAQIIDTFHTGSADLERQVARAVTAIVLAADG